MYKSQLMNIIDGEPISKFSFQGCFASNEIPKIQKNKFIILNTHPSEKQGEHWTVLFRENGDLYEFFDSLGQHPKNYSFQNFPSKCNFSKIMIQNPFQDTCGYFCLYYIFYKCRGKKLVDIFDNSFINDKYIKMRVNQLYGV